MQAILISLFLLFAFIGANGQSLFNPNIIINDYGLPETSQRELSNLEEQLSMMLERYAPHIKVGYVPKRPIDITIALYIDKALGNEYSGSMEVALYRPVYGGKSQDLLVLFDESNFTFTYQSQHTLDLQNTDVPETVILRKVYYYATLGAMYYYDSFALYGGNPFLEYLERYSQYLSDAWRSTYTATKYQTSKYIPDIHLLELRSEWGDKFRELWYLYHRQGVDSPTAQAYGDTTKIVLTGLLQLRELDSTLSFFRLFSDAKVIQLSQYFELNKTSLATENKRLAEELFPTIVFTR